MQGNWVSNPFASYSMTKKGQLQNCNLMKHHKSKAHKAAVKEWLKEGGCVGPSPDAAPSLSQFQELMECFGEKRSLTQKELQMAWCVAEGLKALDQKFIAKSSHISLMRDERHGRLAIRFMAVAPDLTTRSGFLGQARQAGTGADNVSLATWAVMKRACSSFLSFLCLSVMLSPLGSKSSSLRSPELEDSSGLSQARPELVAPAPHWQSPWPRPSFCASPAPCVVLQDADRHRVGQSHHLPAWY